MRMPPYFEIKCREGYRLVMRDAENVDTRDARDPAADEHRIRQGRIVVAGQNQDRHPRFGEEPGRAVENSGAQLIALERITGQQNQVCSQVPAVASTAFSPPMPPPSSTWTSELCTRTTPGCEAAIMYNKAPPP